MSDIFNHAADAMDSLIDVEYNGRYDYEGREEDDVCEYSCQSMPRRRHMQIRREQQRREVHWQCFYSEQYDEETNDSVTGKYLIFSADANLLSVIAQWETTFGWCRLAKISTAPKNGDYVLCLYDTSNDRMHDLDTMYGDSELVKYRWWKSDADTRAGKYSKQFVEG